MQRDVPFHAWAYRVGRDEVCPVFPDGCRDVLIVRRPGEPTSAWLTAFDARPRAAILRRGTELTGYRLRPGAVVDDAVLSAVARSPAEAGSILLDAVGRPGDLDEAIAALTSPHATTRAVAKTLGVSLRTVQRLFRQLSLPPPEYWRLLARARRAVALLSSPAPLAEIAHASGFSDQAHMTREVSRWFGRPPMQLRKDADLLGVLTQPGLANWTGEQSSIR